MAIRNHEAPGLTFVRLFYLETEISLQNKVYAQIGLIPALTQRHRMRSEIYCSKNNDDIAKVNTK